MNTPSPRADIDPENLHQPEAELLRLYGSHTLAFPGLAPKHQHFLAPGGTGLVNYQLLRKVAIVLGDPVCAPEACEQTIRGFLDFCAQQHWRAALLWGNASKLLAVAMNTVLSYLVMRFWTFSNRSSCGPVVN